MKKTGVCPKCRSKQIIHFDNLRTGGGFGGGDSLGVGSGALGGISKKFEAFMCASCGYTELYMPEKELKNFLKEEERMNKFLK